MGSRKKIDVDWLEAVRREGYLLPTDKNSPAEDIPPSCSVSIAGPVSSGSIFQSEIDPSDLPPELDAANMAFRAITNGYGDQSATARNRLIDYLEKHFQDFKPEQMQRIATVANPDKTTGRKKSSKE